MMNYTYGWNCTCGESNVNSWDIPAKELGNDTLTNYCDRCGAEHEHLPLTVDMTVKKICTERPELIDMFKLLDNCSDMFDLGYVDNTLEQAVMDYLSNETFVAVSAVHTFALGTDKEIDYNTWEYTYYCLIDIICEELN